MSVISYPASSPYAATSQTSWHIGRQVFRPIPPDGNDILYILKSQHQYRPDRLAYDLYRDPSYWWVFCVRNPFLRAEPVWDFLPGLEIMVPTADFLRRILGT